MNRIQVSFVGLLLCLVALSLSSDETEDPPKCPPERFYNSSETLPSLCENDSNCTDGKLCCLDNGARFCKPPAKEREGSCLKEPPMSGTYKPCDDECSSDSECTAGYKCCFGTCGYSCKPTTVDKKGFCGKGKLCLVPQRFFCFNDTGCPYNEKCCPFECTQICMPPLAERPGKCPSEASEDSESSENPTEKTDICNSDADCKNPNKCCNTMSGKNCTIPIQE